jgi:hypothetical protein
LLGFHFKNRIYKGLLLGVVASLTLTFNLNTKISADIAVTGNVSGGTLSDINNNNAIQQQNASQNLNQIQISNSSRAGLIGAGISGGAANTVVGSPSAFANTHLFNAPWNYTPPAILFHPSKTINDGSIFNCCRIVNIGAQVRRGIKDRLFGIYDEREFIASGAPGGPPFAGPVIACGLNTQLSAGCVNYVGTGYVFMEEYASTEAALVSLSAMAARNGANIVGNVNCAFAETIRTYSTSLGASFGFSDGVGQDGSVGTSAGASWGTSRVKRPVQPHCTGDFYVGNASGCYAMASNQNQTYFPQPIPYRRYLPPPQYVQQQAAYQQPVRGLW